MTRRERRLAAPRLIVSSNISLSVYTVAEYQVSLGDRHASINHLRFNSLVISDTQDTNQVRLSIGSPD